MNVVPLSRYAFGGYMLPCTNVITLVNVGHGFLVCTRIVDPYTIRVHTKKPWPTFTKVMTFVQGSMYPPKAYRDKGTTFISKNPIGTGPYKFVRWSEDRTEERP